MDKGLDQSDRLDRIEESINIYLMPLLYGAGTDIEFRFRSPVEDDHDFNLKQSTQLFNDGAITINEHRKTNGYEAIEDGDRYKMGTSAAYLEDHAETEGFFAQPTPEEPEKETKSGVEELRNVLKEDQKDSDEELRELAWRRFAEKQERIERAFKSTVRSLFSKQQKALLKEIKSKDSLDVSSPRF